MAKTPETSASPTGPGLEVNNLRAWYGRTQALFGVDLRVSPGATMALVGTNGAGKTSLLRSVLGLIRSRGEVSIEGQKVSHLPGHQRVRRHGIGVVHEGRGLYYHLSVRDNIRVGYRRLSDAAIENVLSVFPDLKDRLSEPVGRLSGGQQQMVALARVMAAEPKLVLLDEPGLGLSPRLIDSVYESLNRIRSTGVTVVLVEQNIDRAASFATQMCIMAGGRVVETLGTADARVASHVKDRVIGLHPRDPGRQQI